MPLRKLGFDTLVVDYRAGAQGLTDVQAFYRRARERTRGRLDVCAVGTSAGGNLALLLAEREPQLRCVIDIAGPTDLPALRALPASYKLAVQAFGQDRLEDFSPVSHASTLRARSLLVYADRDPIVPVAQGREMARADPSARLITLAPGGATFVHNSVSDAARGDGVTRKSRQAFRPGRRGSVPGAVGPLGRRATDTLARMGRIADRGSRIADRRGALSAVNGFDGPRKAYDSDCAGHGSQRGGHGRSHLCLAARWTRARGSRPDRHHLGLAQQVRHQDAGTVWTAAIARAQRGPDGAAVVGGAADWLHEESMLAGALSAASGGRAR